MGPECHKLDVGLPGDYVRVSFFTDEHFDVTFTFVNPRSLSSWAPGCSPVRQPFPPPTVVPLASGVPTPVDAPHYAVLMLPVGDRGARDMVVELRPSIPDPTRVYTSFQGLDRPGPMYDNRALGPPHDADLYTLTFRGAPERLRVMVRGCIVGAHALAPNATMPLTVTTTDGAGFTGPQGEFTLVPPTDISDDLATVTVPKYSHDDILDDDFAGDVTIFTFQPPAGTKRFRVEVTDLYDAQVVLRLVEDEDPSLLENLNSICKNAAQHEIHVACRPSQECVLRRDICGSATTSDSTTASVGGPSHQRTFVTARINNDDATRLPSRWTLVVRAAAQYRNVDGRYTVRFVAEPEPPASLLVLGAETHGSVAAGVYAHHRVHLTAADLAPYARLEVRVAMQQEDARPGMQDSAPSEHGSSYYNVPSYVPTVYIQYGRKAGAYEDCYTNQAVCTDMHCVMLVPYCLLGEGDWFISVINTFGGMNRPMQYAISANLTAPTPLTPGEPVEGAVGQWADTGSVEYVLELSEPAYISALLFNDYQADIAGDIKWIVAFNEPPSVLDQYSIPSTCGTLQVTSGYNIKSNSIPYPGANFPAGRLFFTVLTEAYTGVRLPVDVSGETLSDVSNWGRNYFGHPLPFVFQVDVTPLSSMPQLMPGEWHTLWDGAPQVYFNATGLTRDAAWLVLDVRTPGRITLPLSIYLESPDDTNAGLSIEINDGSATPREEVSHPLRPAYFDGIENFTVTAFVPVSSLVDASQWSASVRIRAVPVVTLAENELRLDEYTIRTYGGNAPVRTYVVPTDELALGDYTSLIVEMTVVHLAPIYDTDAAEEGMVLTANMGHPLLLVGSNPDLRTALTFSSCTSARHCELRITRCVLTQPGPLFLSVEPASATTAAGDGYANARYTLQWRLDEPRPIAVSLAHGGGLADSLPPMDSLIPNKKDDPDGTYNGHNRFYSFRTPAEVPAGTTMVLRLASIATSSATKGAFANTTRGDDSNDASTQRAGVYGPKWTSSHTVEPYNSSLNDYDSTPYSWQEPSSSSPSYNTARDKRVRPLAVTIDDHQYITALLLSMTNEVDAPGVPPGPNSDVLFGADGCGATVPSWAYLLCTSKLSKESAACELRVPRDDFHPNTTYYVSVAGAARRDAVQIDRLGYSLNVQFAQPSYATAEILLNSNRSTINTTLDQIVDYYVDISAAPVGSVYEIQLEASTGTTLLVMAAVAGDAGDRARVNDYDEVMWFSHQDMRPYHPHRARCNFRSFEAVPRCFMQIIKSAATMTRLWIVVESGEAATIGVIEVPITPLPLDGSPTPAVDINTLRGAASNASLRYAYFSYDFTDVDYLGPGDFIQKTTYTRVQLDLTCDNPSVVIPHYATYPDTDLPRIGFPTQLATSYNGSFGYHLQLPTLGDDPSWQTALKGVIGVVFEFSLMPDDNLGACEFTTRLYRPPNLAAILLDETPVDVYLQGNITAFRLTLPDGVSAAGFRENKPVIRVTSSDFSGVTVCFSYEDSPRCKPAAVPSGLENMYFRFPAGRKMRYHMVIAGTATFTVVGKWQQATMVDLTGSTTSFLANASVDPFDEGNLNLVRVLLPTTIPHAGVLFYADADNALSQFSLTHGQTIGPDPNDYNYCPLLTDPASCQDPTMHLDGYRIYPVASTDGNLYVDTYIFDVSLPNRIRVYISVETTKATLVDGALTDITLTPGSVVAASLPMPRHRLPSYTAYSSTPTFDVFNSIDTLGNSGNVKFPSNGDLSYPLCDFVERNHNEAMTVWLVARSSIDNVTVQFQMDADEPVSLLPNAPVYNLRNGGLLDRIFVVEIPRGLKTWYLDTNGTNYMGNIDVRLDSWRQLFCATVKEPTLFSTMSSSAFETVALQRLYIWVTLVDSSLVTGGDIGALTFVASTYDLTLDSTGQGSVVGFSLPEDATASHRVIIPPALGQLGNLTVVVTARKGFASVFVRLVPDGEFLNYGHSWGTGTAPSDEDAGVARASGCPSPHAGDCSVDPLSPSCTTVFLLGAMPSNYELIIYTRTDSSDVPRETVLEFDVTFAPIPLESLKVNEVKHVSVYETRYWVVDVETMPSNGELIPVHFGFASVVTNARYPLRGCNKENDNDSPHSSGRLYITTVGTGSLVVYLSHTNRAMYEEHTFPIGFAPILHPAPLRLLPGETISVPIPYAAFGRTFTVALTPGTYGRVVVTSDPIAKVTASCASCSFDETTSFDSTTRANIHSTWVFDARKGLEQWIVIASPETSDALRSKSFNITYDEIIPGVAASSVIGLGVHAAPLYGMLYAVLDPSVFAPGDLVELLFGTTPGYFDFTTVVDDVEQDMSGEDWCHDESMEMGIAYAPRPTGTSGRYCRVTLRMGHNSTGIILTPAAYEHSPYVEAPPKMLEMRILCTRREALPLTRGVPHIEHGSPGRGRAYSAWNDPALVTVDAYESVGSTNPLSDQIPYYDTKNLYGRGDHRLFLFDVPAGASRMQMTILARQEKFIAAFAHERVPVIDMISTFDDQATAAPFFMSGAHVLPDQHQYGLTLEDVFTKTGRYYLVVRTMNRGTGYTVSFNYDMFIMPVVEPVLGQTLLRAFTPEQVGSPYVTVKVPVTPGAWYAFDSGDGYYRGRFTPFSPSLNPRDSSLSSLRLSLLSTVDGNEESRYQYDLDDPAVYIGLNDDTTLFITQVEAAPPAVDVTLGQFISLRYNAISDFEPSLRTRRSWVHFTIPEAQVGYALHAEVEGGEWANNNFMPVNFTGGLPRLCSTDVRMPFSLTPYPDEFDFDVDLDYNITFYAVAPIVVSEANLTFTLRRGAAVQELIVPAGGITLLQLRALDGTFDYGVYPAEASPCGAPRPTPDIFRPMASCAGTGACTVYLSPSSSPRHLMVTQRAPYIIQNNVPANRITIKMLTGAAKCQPSDTPAFCTDAPSSVVTDFDSVATLDERASLAMDFLLSDFSGFALTATCSAALKTLYCLHYLPPCNTTTGEEVPICSSLCDAAEAACGLSVLRLLGVRYAFCQLEARGECYPTAAAAPPPAQAPVGAVVAATQGTSTSTVLAIVLGVVLSLLGLAGLGVVGVFVRRYQGRKHPAAHKAVHGEDSEAGSDDGALTPGGRVHPSAGLGPSASHLASLARSGAVSSAGGAYHAAPASESTEMVRLSTSATTASATASTTATGTGGSSLGTSAWVSATAGGSASASRLHSSQLGSGNGSVALGYESDVVSSATSGASSGAASAGNEARRTRGMPRSEDFPTTDDY